MPCSPLISFSIIKGVSSDCVRNKTKEISAQVDRGPHSRVCACETLTQLNTPTDMSGNTYFFKITFKQLPQSLLRKR